MELFTTGVSAATTTTPLSLENSLKRCVDSALVDRPTEFIFLSSFALIVQIFLTDNGFKPIKEVLYDEMRDKYGERVVVAGEHTSTVTAYKAL